MDAGAAFNIVDQFSSGSGSTIIEIDINYEVLQKLSTGQTIDIKAYNDYYEELYTTVEFILPAIKNESSKPPPKIIVGNLNPENVLTISFTEKMIFPKNIK